MVALVISPFNGHIRAFRFKIGFSWDRKRTAICCPWTTSIIVRNEPVSSLTSERCMVYDIYRRRSRHNSIRFPPRQTRTGSGGIPFRDFDVRDRGPFFESTACFPFSGKSDLGHLRQPPRPVYVSCVQVSMQEFLELQYVEIHCILRCTKS